MKTENRVEILKFDVLFNQPRYKVIDGKDGYTLLPEGAKIIASNINSKLIIPESKAVLKENKETISATPKIGKRDEVDQYTSEDEEEQKIIEILTVPEDLIGKIIGEPGTTIKSIIAKSKAFIKTGTRESVTKAKEMIQRIADDTEPNKRKSRKQRKADKITTSKKTKSKWQSGCVRPEWVNQVNKKKSIKVENVCNACFKCNKSKLCKLKKLLSEFSLQTKIKNNNSVERVSATYPARQTQPIKTVSEAEYFFFIK